MKRALTVAGSDSGGGAGIQADLKTFAALGVYGTSAITTVTAQNTTGVTGVAALTPEFVGQQIDAVLKDIGADSVKTGMLANAEIISVVAAKIRAYGIENLVVDPVMMGLGGRDPEQREKGISTYKNELFPLAKVVTPNIFGVKFLTGKEMKSVGDAKEAAKSIYDMGVKCVVVKGGHLEGDPVDVLYDGKEFVTFAAERIPTKNTHGVGCSFSSAIAAYLAQGMDVREAVSTTKQFVNTIIKNSLPFGVGPGPVNHLAGLYREADRYEVVMNLTQAAEMMKEAKVAHLIPETMSNLAMAVVNAQDTEDVAAFPGRLIRFGDSIRALAAPEFGTSRRIARMCLMLMKIDPAYRSSINILWSEKIQTAAEGLGMRGIESLLPDRPGMPMPVQPSREERIAAFKAENGKMPDFAFHKGGYRMEPHMELFGEDAMAVAKKVIQIAEATR